MARGPYFPNPLFLGFEDIERMLERAGKGAQEGYPPYNIERIGQDRLRITLAVAGFSRESLSVTIEDNQLVIRGRQPDAGERDYLHRGIATRQFQRAFILAEGIEVGTADLQNGLLSIDLRRPRPETVVRTVAINAGETAESGGSGMDIVTKKPTTG